MSTLFENLRQSLAQKGEAPVSQQRGIEAGLKAKTGKAAPSGGVLSSRLGEQSAIAQSKQQLAQQETAGRLTGEELVSKERDLAKQEERKLEALESQKRMTESGLATKATLQREGMADAEDLAGMELDANRQQKTFAINTAAASKLREMSEARKISTDNMFSSFKRSNLELEDRKDAAKLEQMGFLLAMQDQQYLDEINRIASVRDLRNDIQFQEEINSQIWGDQMTLLMGDLNFKWDEAVKDAEFNKQLAKIDIDAALAMANATMEQDAQRAQWEGGGTILTEGLKYAATPSAEDKKKKVP